MEKRALSEKKTAEGRIFQAKTTKLCDDSGGVQPGGETHSYTHPQSGVSPPVSPCVNRYPKELPESSYFKALP